jgi:hypothetical protein
MIELIYELFGIDPPIPGWSSRVGKYQQIMLERQGLAGFGYSWHRAHLERIREADPVRGVPVTRVTYRRNTA